MSNLLFICSRNQWRSPTAERIWCRRPGFTARSAGTSPRARRTVGVRDIEWADAVFVMEQKHRSQLKAAFPGLMHYKAIHILDIPDEYRYMDTELVEILTVSVSAILGIE